MKRTTGIPADAGRKTCTCPCRSGWRRCGRRAAERSAGWVLNGKTVTQEVLAQRTLMADENGPALAAAVGNCSPFAGNWPL